MGKDDPCARLAKAENNYSTIEREGLFMVYVLQKYMHYLLGGHFNMYTDHSMLKYLVNKPMLGVRENLQVALIIPGVCF